jgi:predicted DNA-binding protein (MmcQ/YjbR family)
MFARRRRRWRRADTSGTLRRMKPKRGPSSELREFALSLPGAREEFPWGERVAKVGKKVFVFLGRDDADKKGLSPKKAAHVGPPGEFGIGVKLPESGKAALGEPFASPESYGLGAKGWVAMRFRAGDRVPMDRLKAWIVESYRAVAPKTLVRKLDGEAEARPARKKK